MRRLARIKAWSRFYNEKANSHLLPYFGARRLTDIGTLEIQVFLNQKALKYSGSGLQHMKATLSRMFSDAVAWNFVRDERDANSTVLRYVQKPLAVPTPSPYDFGNSSNRTLASAWLFDAGGGAIAYFGEVVICEDDKGRDMEKDVVSQLGSLGSSLHTLGDVWLAAEQKYWADNQGNGEVFRAPRIYLGIMAFFGDPSLRLPRLI